MFTKKNFTILGIVALSVVALAVLGIGGAVADSPTESEYSTILSNMTGDGTEANPYVITNVDELQAIDGDRDAHYVLGNDINASETEDWNTLGTQSQQITDNYIFTLDYIPNESTITVINESTDTERTDAIYTGDDSDPTVVIDSLATGTQTLTYEPKNPNQGFEPISDGANGFFTGSFDGQGYTINNLYINTKNITQSSSGLFFVNQGTISQVNLHDVYIKSAYGDAGAVASGNEGTISNVSASGDVIANVSAGGLVGGQLGILTQDAIIDNAYADVTVNGNDNVGGLVGKINEGEIKKSYAIGTVSGNNNVGGLVGVKGTNATVTDSYYNTNTTNQSTSAGSSVGLTTSEMTGSSASTNMNLDFTSTWSTVTSADADASADSYPILQSLDRVEQLTYFDVYEVPTYTVDVSVVDSNGTTIDNTTVTINGVTGATQDLSDGTYTITANADGYDQVSQDITVNGASEFVSITLTETTYLLDVDLSFDADDDRSTSSQVYIDDELTFEKQVTDGVHRIVVINTNNNNEMYNDTVTVNSEDKLVNISIPYEDSESVIVDSGNQVADDVSYAMYMIIIFGIAGVILTTLLGLIKFKQ